MSKAKTDHTPPAHPNRRPIARLVFATCAALAAVALAACGSDESEDTEADSGSETATITVYSGREPELIEPMIDLYSETTGTEVEVRFGDSGPLAATLVEEADNAVADVFFSQDAGSLGVLNAAGLLEPLPEEILAEVDPAYRSGDGAWVGVTGRTRVIAHSSELDPAELPDSPLELTEPEWEGRVGWAPTNASLQGYVTALRLVEGEEVAREWLEGMVANDTQVYESNTPTRDAIAAGEIEVGLINHYYVAQAKAEDPDYPVEVFYPPEGLGSLINTAGVAVLNTSEQQEQALEFVEFMLGVEAQEFFAESSLEYPLAAGVEAADDLLPLSEVPAPEVDLSGIDDTQGTIELMRETGAL